MDLNTIWFLLVGVLITGYAVLDGFDLGVGALHLFTREEEERRIFINAIGPVWDGNEVWLLTGGGALFAAFPIVYATAFSSFYLALMLLVAALMFRAVSFEFRGKLAGGGWRRLWDWSFGLGSVVPAVLYGVAVGNVVRGIPIDASGAFTGNFLGLLNPYALLVGLLTLAMFVMHGAAYMLLKTEGQLRERLRRWNLGAWVAFVVLYALATAASLSVAAYAFDGVLASPLAWALLALLAIAVVAIPITNRRGKLGWTFVGTSGSVIAVIGLAAVGLFPRLLPSSLDLGYSLTIYNAASTPLTQTVMLIIALIGMPLVILYTAWVYRVFKGKVVLTEDSY